MPPQPEDGSYLWLTEGWTILQTGNNVIAGMTLCSAELSLWNITLERLIALGNRLHVCPGPEPLILVSKSIQLNVFPGIIN